MTTSRPRVLLIEDDAVMGEAMAQRFALEGVDVTWAKLGREGLAALRRGPWDLVVSDIRLPDANGEDIYRRALPELGRTPIVFVTAYGEIDQAVRLVRAGADDYLTKPFPFEKLMERIATAVPASPDAPMPACSPAMQAVEAMLERVADIDSTVLLTGETGSGKEVAARQLHALSPRRDEPFVAVNCAAIPEELAESEIFGHEKGAFTGAIARHAGYAEQAGKGTLLLDEVGDLPPAIQAKLLRLIEDRGFRRVGGRETIRFGARLVAATNVDLEVAVREGRFREDLWFRLAVIPVRVPPLRERQEEIVPLARHFLAGFARSFGRKVRHVDAEAEAALVQHPWAGNVRELRNRVERAVALAAGDTLRTVDLFPETGLGIPASPAGRRGGEADGGATATLAEVREQAERDHIQSVIAETGGRVTEAAQRLGVSRSTLWERMKKLGLSARDD